MLELLELLELLGAGVPPFMFGQLCVLVGVGAGDELAPADELAPDDDDVVRTSVVPVVAAPPVAASATPVPAAPTPAATMPVMISRRARPLILEAIWFLLLRRPPHGAAAVHDQPPQPDCRPPAAVLSAHSDLPAASRAQTEIR